MIEQGLASQIRTLRKRAGLTLKELGAALGMTPQGVSAWERGAAQVPSATIPRLAECLGVTISDLYGVADQRPGNLEEEGLLAYTAEERAVFTEEDYKSIRDFIEYRKAKRLAERGEQGRRTP